MGGMSPEPNWLNPAEAHAWRTFLNAHRHLVARLNRLLLQDTGLTAADYEILAVLSEHPTGRIPAQDMSAMLQWEKSRLSHQVRRMEEVGLLIREPNPADGRSALICLLPAGRRAIEDASPKHVQNVRRNFIDLFTPAELDTLAALNERVVHHLGGEPLPEQSFSDEPAHPH